jgi:opacity protein-like surface antigen
MKKELGLTLAAMIATLPLANAAQTIDFGSNLPTGTVANGYAGFDWHGAQNDVFADTTPSFFGSAFITEFSRTAPFDLNSMVVQELNSDAPSIGETSSNTTTIFGYLNGTLVDTLTENYAFGGGTLLTLNMDDVNEVKFDTTNVRTVFGQPVIIRTPDLTMVSQLTVDNVVTKAPEIDPSTAASALTLLIGGLLVITGRRGFSSERSVPTSG